MNDFVKAYRAATKKLDLSAYSTKDKRLVPDSKADRKAKADALGEKLNALQDVLYGQGKHRVLVVLQGMDTAGKDGTIRHVFQHTDPLGMRVQAFKVLSEAERARDYLWRVHQVVPKDGEIVIFNRSHYEDVLTTLVHDVIDEAEFKRRLAHINDFERMLSETGTTIIKFFLHISKDEQRERLQARLDNPDKHWKFNPSDLNDRKLWDKFQQTYAAAISATDNEHAPWYIIPADSKSSRDVIILEILLAHLQKLDLAYPEVDSSNWVKTVV